VNVTVGDERSGATVVLFDPNLDIAVLLAPDIDAAPLRWTTRNPSRGTEGAAIGFPDGGPQTVVAAAVTASYRAIGRDIYGRGRVPRDIIELRARIERGDSGGPLVLDDGTVGGVVFAESRTDPSVGYALAPVPVAVAVRPAVGRTQRVGTGECAR
jgi:S1-C subfamily serine protease